MMSTPSQFGMDAHQVLEKIILKILKILDLWDFIFIQHRMLKIKMKLSNYLKAIHNAKKLSDILNIKIKILNLGGGFACNHGKTKSNFKYYKVKKAIDKEMKKYFSLSEYKDLNLYFESGRFLVGTCGGLVAKVIDKNVSKGEQFIILNSGINHLSGMTGIGRLQRLRPDYQLLNQKNNTKKERVNIVGPLCTPLDFWNKSFYCKKFNIGDYIFIPNVSSYGLTASLVMFSGHELPKELIINKNKVVKVMKTNNRLVNEKKY